MHAIQHRKFCSFVYQHQGDKDLKGPSDFSGAGSAKFQDNADNDDDEEEEEEQQPVRSTRSRVLSKPTPSQKPAVRTIAIIAEEG